MTAIKQVKAFIVETDDPDETVIAFATSNVAARRQGADEIGADFGSVSCRRLPWADEYAGKGIPAEAYIQHGWRVSCTNCGDMVSQDSYTVDESGKEIPHNPVYCGEHVYCCPDCRSAHEAEVAEQNAKFAAFEKRVREARPDLQFKTFRGAYPYRTMTGEFTFDGAQYGGSVRDEGDGNLKWFIAQGDMADWEYLEAERAAQQGEGGER